MRRFDRFIAIAFSLFLCLLSAGLSDVIGRAIMLFLAITVIVNDVVYRRTP
jgi:hypothetical protein